jgi:hypothetical protein
MSRHEIGMLDGVEYKLVYDQRGNQQPCDVEYRKEWRWFLEADGFYVGDFGTKRAALAYVSKSQRSK